MTASNADIDALLERVFRKETLSEREITGVCDHVKEILKRESNMQLVTAPVVGFTSAQTFAGIAAPLVKTAALIV